MFYQLNTTCNNVWLLFKLPCLTCCVFPAVCLQPGYGDVSQGCVRCSCSLTGSVSRDCDPVTGQCQCRTGIGGNRCDRCAEGYFGFSQRGCQRKWWRWLLWRKHLVLGFAGILYACLVLHWVGIWDMCLALCNAGIRVSCFLERNFTVYKL